MIREKKKRKMLTYEKGTLWLSPKTNYNDYAIIYCHSSFGEDYLEQLYIRFDGKSVKEEKTRIEAKDGYI